MLKNLGFGEIFFLALMALLFFGPERLPQIGARLGRWVSQLTRYSSAFMNEWRDEALAIHDAVEEVKGIRDELALARAEIASTLDTARGDMGEAISGARLDVQQQIKGATHLPSGSAPASLPPTTETGEEAAIAKTQQILGNLAQKRAQTEAERPTPAIEAVAQPESAASPPLPKRPSTVQRGVPDVSPADIERLRDQVTNLKKAMSALRNELALYRTELQPPHSPIGLEEAAHPAEERPATPAEKIDPMAIVASP
jgi:sec-independent protein translocase protein TatB